MKKRRARLISVFLRRFISLSICAWTVCVEAQSVTWQFLPWPANSDWPAQQGSPATTNGNQLILSGQDVETVQSYTAQSTISFDLNAHSVWPLNPDGHLFLYYVPLGQPTDVTPPQNTVIDLLFLTSGGNAITIYRDAFRSGQSTLWSGVPMNFSLQTTYHMVLESSASGQLNFTIDGQSFPVPGTDVMPYSDFQVRLATWQPGGNYEIDNFSVIPEPATLALVSVGLAGLLAASRRRRSS